MQFSIQLLALALLVGLATASASVVLDNSLVDQDGVGSIPNSGGLLGNGIECQTSGTSPSVTDVMDAANTLANTTETCTVAGPERCTTLETTGEAAIALCGPVGASIPCISLKTLAEAVISACQKQGRVSAVANVGISGFQLEDLQAEYFLRAGA